MKEEIVRKESILIADDDESIRRGLEIIFVKNGYEVEIAETGKEALEKAQGRLFNAALLDIRMPDIGGVDLIAPLKKIHPDMAIIMVTAYATVETVARALREEVSAFIIKPFNTNEVLARVREAIEKLHLIIEMKQNLPI